ncbi:MAG: hypothetical protein JSU82_01620 [Rhodospirillales bacterium]|nr:MAG: hypothetical protein JSU82_01620 [Rhodospirillales bacterium]
MLTTVSRAVFSAIILTAFATVGGAFAEPYAPLVKDPGKPTIEGQELGYPLEKMVLQEAAKNMPDRGAVEQPPYPGAVVVNARKAGKGSTNGVDYTVLPSVILHTTDDVATVVAFYVEALPGWTKYDYFGMDYLYKGSGEFKPMEKSGYETPHVAITKLHSAMKYHAMPEAVTEITIFYN